MNLRVRPRVQVVLNMSSSLEPEPVIQEIIKIQPYMYGAFNVKSNAQNPELFQNVFSKDRGFEGSISDGMARIHLLRISTLIIILYN